jgi:hypothetical protein
MTPLGKQIVSGMVLTALGGFMWAIIVSLIAVFRGSGSWSEVAWFPPIGVLYTSWFVLPLGVLLGVLLPRFARRCSAVCAIVCAALLGAGLGVVAAYLTTKFVWRVAFREYAVTMIPFCSVWLTGWTWWLNWRETHERAT